jgi:hypothetical protein
MVDQDFWQRPWSHGHAWALVAAAMGGAWAAQALHPTAALGMPGPPWNWLVAGGPAIVAVVLGVLRPRHPVLAFLGGAPLAIAALAAIAAAAWPIAVFPVGHQAPDWLRRIGLGDPLSSLPFAVALIVIVANLAVALGRRLRLPADGRLRFVLVHGGLLIAVVGAAAGHGGLRKARFALHEGAPPGATITCDDGQRQDLPFALRLDDFVLERFPPVLVLLTGERVLAGETPLADGVQETLDGCTVRVERWIPAAAIPAAGADPVSFADVGANPAALVTVGRGNDEPWATGWLHPGGPLGPTLSVSLPDGRSLHLDQPRPKRFLARMQVVRSGVASPIEITVNRPLRRDGWAIYLLSYDEAQGPASTIAIFEAIEDRALPAVYLGLALLILGVLWHLWSPRPVTSRGGDLP